MAYAMMYPIAKRGGDRKSDQFANLQVDRNEEKIDASAISRARFILKNDREKAELVRDGHPDYPLSKTYDAVKSRGRSFPSNERRSLGLGNPENIS